MPRDRIEALEEQMRHLRETLETSEDQREAMALLPERVDDLREALKDVRALVRDFRKACDDRLDALTRETPDGGYEAKAGRIDFKTWLLIVSTVVVPIVVAIITLHPR